jgi:hypothetical protein
VVTASLQRKDQTVKDAHVVSKLSDVVRTEKQPQKVLLSMDVQTRVLNLALDAVQVKKF